MTAWTRAHLIMMLVGLGLAGCGDDDDDTAADGDGDADADADADGDGDGDGDGDCDAMGEGEVFVLASDFAVGLYGWAPLADLGAFEDLGPAEGDAVAVETAGRFVILERTLGAATVLDDELAIEKNFSVADPEGPAPNPHDFAILAPNKAYVARFSQGTLAIVDPSAGTITGTIDLSARDPDGVPDMEAIALDGDRALVALERLDGFDPGDASEVVVIDTATDAVTGTIALPLTNPFGRVRTHGTTGELLLACVGAYGTADGGIVGLGDDGASPHVIVTEANLGGDVGSFVIADDTHGFAIVAVDFITRLVPFDPSAGTVGDSLLVSEGYDLADVEMVGGRLVVADAAPSAPGLRVFALSGVECTDGPLDVGLPPRVVLAM